jgi:hypothetical protein
VATVIERHELRAWRRRREQPQRRVLHARGELLASLPPRHHLVAMTAWNRCPLSAVPLDVHELTAQVGRELPRVEMPRDVIEATRAAFLDCVPRLRAVPGGRT